MPCHRVIAAGGGSAATAAAKVSSDRSSPPEGVDRLRRARPRARPGAVDAGPAAGEAKILNITDLFDSYFLT